MWPFGSVDQKLWPFPSKLPIPCLVYAPTSNAGKNSFWWQRFFYFLSFHEFMKHVFILSSLPIFALLCVFTVLTSFIPVLSASCFNTRPATHHRTTSTSSPLAVLEPSVYPAYSRSVNVKYTNVFNVILFIKVLPCSRRLTHTKHVLVWSETDPSSPLWALWWGAAEQ